MLILVLASIVGPGLMNIILILGFLGWPNVVQIFEGSVHKCLMLQLITEI